VAGSQVKHGTGKLASGEACTSESKECDRDVTIRDQISALEALARIDADVRRLEEELGKQRAAREALRSEVASLDARIALDSQRVTDIERTRSELTTELRQTTQQVERSREKLQRSRNERESNAAQREVEELRRLVRDHEREIEKLGQLLESARASIADASSKRASLTAGSTITDGSEAATDTDQPSQLEEQLRERTAAREVAGQALPQALFRRYETIRTRRPNAIASTHNGTCGGCHIAVPPMMFQKMLRQEEFEQCPNCRRILYYVRASDHAGTAGDAGASGT